MWLIIFWDGSGVIRGGYGESCMNKYCPAAVVHIEGQACSIKLSVFYFLVLAAHMDLTYRVALSWSTFNH